MPAKSFIRKLSINYRPLLIVGLLAAAMLLPLLQPPRPHQLCQHVTKLIPIPAASATPRKITTMTIKNSFIIDMLFRLLKKRNIGDV